MEKGASWPSVTSRGAKPQRSGSGREKCPRSRDVRADTLSDRMTVCRRAVFFPGNLSAGARTENRLKAHDSSSGRLERKVGTQHA